MLDVEGQDQTIGAHLCVVFADVVGYSSLSAKNEVATHKMWIDFRHACLEPVASKYNSSVIRMLGDGCLLSFKTPEDGLRWCIDVRSAVLADRLGTAPRWPRLSLRFGAHVCDVIHEDHDIYGDGVNTTKRLQEKAQPDGVLLSDNLIAELKEQDDCEFRYLGALNFKNLDTPIPTHEVVFSDASLPVRENVEKLPSIAIIPFRNLTANPDYNYFAEGLIDDIITSLAGLKELQVIARGSTLPFAQQTVDARDIARILSVRYILQGSIQEAGETIRISLSFEDAETGDTLFGEKCEFSHRELFKIQDNIVRDIVARVAPNVRAVELEKALRKPPENFTAYQCTLRALDLMKSLERDDFDKAKSFLDKAMALDPEFVLPVAWAVRWYCIYIGQGWCDEREKAVKKAKALATKAINIDRQNPLALAAFGHVKSYLEREYETALVYFDRARQVGPSHAITWMLSSATLSYLGKGEEAVEHARRGLQLSPNDSELYQFYDFMSIAYYCTSKFEEASTWAKLSYAENPHYSSSLRQMIVCKAALGDEKGASEFGGLLTEVDPAFTMQDYEKICPIQIEPIRSQYLTHLASAGLPVG